VENNHAAVATLSTTQQSYIKRPTNGKASTESPTKKSQVETTTVSRHHNEFNTATQPPNPPKKKQKKKLPLAMARLRQQTNTRMKTSHQKTQVENNLSSLVAQECTSTTISTQQNRAANIRK
jgi:hypothetical protein